MFLKGLAALFLSRDPRGFAKKMETGGLCQQDCFWKIWSHTAFLTSGGLFAAVLLPASFPRGQSYMTLALELPNPEKMQAKFSMKDILTPCWPALIT